MKPISLEMKSFGSYGQKTVIDFSKPQQNIFLISGDTGAGKTTIFDAMVFALYGEASSELNKKDGRELQSDYAAIDEEPYVELLFSEREGDEDRIYMVKRSPQHIRSYKRKNGTTNVSEEVTLTMPDGTIYPQKETDKKLIEIIGLTKSQFMQVGMIAQGEFMNLLRSRSDDKKQVFRKLFATGLYQDIVDELYRRKKEMEKELAKYGTRASTEISHVEIPSMEDMDELYDDEVIKAQFDKIRLLKKSIISSDSYKGAETEELYELMGIVCPQLKAVKKAKDKELALALKGRDKAREDHAAAESLQGFWQQLDRAQKDLALCEEEEKDIKALEKLGRNIELSWMIKESYDRFSDKQKELDKEGKELNECRKLAPVAASETEEKKDLYSAADRKRSDTAAAFNRTKEKTQRALDTFDGIDKLGTEIELCEKVFKEMAAKHKKAADDENAYKENKKLWKEEAEEIGNPAGLIEQHKKTLQDLEMAMENLKEYVCAGDELSQTASELDKGRKKYELSKKAYEEYREELSAKESVFYDAQAGMLAKYKLKANEPCPVCGSLDHPKPCILPDDIKEMTRQEIEEMRSSADRLRKSMEEDAAAVNALIAVHKEKEAQAGSTLSRLETSVKRAGLEMKAGPLGDIKEAENDLSLMLSDHYQKEEKLVRELERKLERKAKLEELLAKADQEEEKLQTAVKDALVSEQRAEKELAEKISAMETLKSSLEYKDREDARKEQEKSRQCLDKADASYKEALSALREAEGKQKSNDALIRKLEGDIPKLQEERDSRKEEYQKVLDNNKMTEPEWKEIISGHKRAEAEELRSKVNEHAKKKESARSLKEEALKNVEGKDRPDMGALGDNVQKASEAYDKAKDWQQRAESVYGTNEKVLANLKPMLETRGDISRRYSKLGGLYSILAGKVTGARMDIETYVQRYYLERILDAANDRFQTMSAGQYELRICSLEQAGTGRNRGLDLMVYSDITGKEREIGTLSGGESFMAALSLALGMADTIQENSAAINMDVMFIDEGFGSLDEHSRNQAVKVLTNMAGSSKLIGIISHVSELSREIEDQLIVTKDENGSHIKWQIS
ncbi:AAA family ATPase [Butyrivibrio sp. MC2013]|uniref:AAA family ATPase n=1 Tax=Butyrivibrio sp. MC2013 TaxID=1280686 RepID=UPI00042A6463|nr:SMC family ATPase [Butyrivibrio sp. MC2013]